MISCKKYCTLAYILLALPAAGYANKADFKITSDSSVHDFANQTLVYSGNAAFETTETLIKGNEIRAYKKEGETNRLQIVGNASFNQVQLTTSQQLQLSAETISYFIDSKQLIAEEQIEFIQKSFKSSTNDTESPQTVEFFKVSGSALNLTAPPSLLTVTGSPLTVRIYVSNEPQLVANATEMQYNQQNSEFILSGKVSLSTGRENIKASKIIYNSASRILQIPKADDQQVQMIQTNSDTHE